MKYLCCKPESRARTTLKKVSSFCAANRFSTNSKMTLVNQRPLQTKLSYNFDNPASSCLAIGYPDVRYQLVVQKLMKKDQTQQKWRMIDRNSITFTEFHTREKAKEKRQKASSFLLNPNSKTSLRKLKRIMQSIIISNIKFPICS